MPRREIKQERAHETRARILEGAAASFAENGFAGATVADILLRSGVTKGALYFHFETKEEVADAVLAAHGEWMRNAVAGLSGVSVQSLLDLGYLVCDALCANALFQAAARLAIERETYGEGRPQAFQLWEGLLTELLDTLNARQAFVTPVDSQRLARMMTGALLGIHLSAQAQGNVEQLHDEVEYFWRSVLPMMVTPEELAGLRLSASPRSALAEA